MVLLLLFRIAIILLFRIVLIFFFVLSFFSSFFELEKFEMAQSSFSNSHFRTPRVPFRAGDIKGTPPAYHLRWGKVGATYVEQGPNDLVNNIPYAGYYGTGCGNPFGYIEGSFPGNHQIIPKPPSQRNSTFHKSLSYGHWQYNNGGT